MVYPNKKKMCGFIIPPTYEVCGVGGGWVYNFWFSVRSLFSLFMCQYLSMLIVSKFLR